MPRSTHTRTGLAAAALAALLAGAPACTMEGDGAPALAGPSELGLSVTLTATPDVVPQDGATASQISILARSASGEPARGVSFSVQTSCMGGMRSFGQLSAQTVTTGADGRATVTYRPPAGAAACSCDTGYSYVAVQASPVGTGYGNGYDPFVRIRLLPQVPAPPPGGPIAIIRYYPSAPVALSVVAFDGTASRDCAAGQSVQDCLNGPQLTDGLRFEWNYGDGDRDWGVGQYHAFPAAGCYTTTLTVTNAEGRASTTAQVIPVAPASN